MNKTRVKTDCIIQKFWVTKLLETDDVNIGIDFTHHAVIAFVIPAAESLFLGLGKSPVGKNLLEYLLFFSKGDKGFTLL